MFVTVLMSWFYMIVIPLCMHIRISSVLWCISEIMHDSRVIVFFVIGLWPFSSISWWRHQMEIFSALLTLCAGNSPITKAPDAEPWYFLWYALEPTVEETIETSEFLDAIAHIWHHCKLLRNCFILLHWHWDIAPMWMNQLGRWMHKAHKAVWHNENKDHYNCDHISWDILHFTVGGPQSEFLWNIS